MDSLQLLKSVTLGSLVVLNAVSGAVGAESLRYDGGRTYYGNCVGETGGTFPTHIKTNFEGTRQEGLDLCLAAYGDKVVAYSVQDNNYYYYDDFLPNTINIHCNFDDQDVPALAEGWELEEYPSYGETPVDSGDQAWATECYDFRAEATSQPTPSSRQAPAYNSGEVYNGTCSDAQGLELPNYSLQITDPPMLPQDGLDLCFATFGESVVAFATSKEGDKPYEDTIVCYFDPSNIPEMPYLWYDQGYHYGLGYAQLPIVGGVTANRETYVCYVFHDETGTSNPTPMPSLSPTLAPNGDAAQTANCLARVVVAVDRTYDTKYPKPAIKAVRSAYEVASAVVEAFPFGDEALLGLLDINRGSVNWRVKLGDEAASSKSLLLDKIAKAQKGLNAGSRSSKSRFPPLFKGVADTLASDGSTPSYTLLVSDGEEKISKMQNFEKLKAGLGQRLGDAAPMILCFRTAGGESTWLFDVVCDKVFFEGMEDGKTLREVADDIAAEICA
ncbi:Hypothetical Protein FCC1311_101782 [Hondaea fermentalgiana]|uniref:Ig-like domain-containing protein n=1 Tax=Hondaea fermentalgiana TaxID=2315210 RepID=A0A2R5GTQ7_9STRA|nr:Hypothetical Protein FCC1311_101782 [Hondaea fermentalgiana]|eukprot:GBG33955.1 Hypothetical Protein FCC1311_101782 [Hondaea fermentalgiana]